MATWNVGYNAAGVLLDFATINDAFAGSTAGDTLVFWYSDANRNNKWYGQFNGGATTPKNLNLIGALEYQKITITSASTIYYWTPNVVGASMTIRNLSFKGVSTPTNAVQFKIDGTTSGCSFVMDSCRLIGGVTYGAQAFASFPQTFKNCYFDGINRAVYAQSVSNVYFYNNITVDCLGAINLQNIGEIKNSVFINSGAVQYFGAGVTASHNVSTRTAPGTNDLSNVKTDELGFWVTDIVGNSRSPLILPESILASGGTPISGISSDIDGLAYETGVVPRGCSRGTTFLPAATAVLTGNSVNGVAGRWTPADISVVKKDETYGVDGTSLVGTYVPSTPGTISFPELDAENNQDGTVTFTVSGATAESTNKIYTALVTEGTWTYQGEFFENDTLTISLDNGRYYGKVESNVGEKSVTGEIAIFDVTDSTTGTERFMDLDHSPSEVVAEYFKDNSIFSEPQKGAIWPLYISHLPDGKGADANAAAITDTAGVVEGRIQRTGELIQHPGLQLRVRSKDYVTGWKKMMSATERAATVSQQFIMLEDVSYKICNISQTSPIIPMGVQDEDRLFLFSVNFLVTIRKEE